MSGYKSVVRNIHTNAALLTNVVTATTVPFTEVAPPPIVSKRRILSENERTRSATANRRQDALQQKFREMYKERRLLIDRHRDAIEAVDTKDLSEIVDAIEFKQFVDKKLLQNILQIIEDDINNLKMLNERQLSVLISAGSKIAEQVSFEHRKKYVEKLWRTIVDENVPIDVLPYNAKISANIENNVEQDVIGILADLEAANIEANEETFGLLSKIYALQGNTIGIMQIIDILKDQNIPATQQLFESLVYSIAYNEEDQRVRTIIQSLGANPAVNVSNLYLSAALAYANKTKNVDKVVKLLIDIPHSINMKKKENLQGIIDVIISLVESGATNVVEKLKPFMFLNQNTKTLPADINQSALTRKIYQLYRKKNEAAAVELFSLLGDESKRQLRRFFEESLYESITDTKRAIYLANIFKEGNVIQYPLLNLINRMYEGRLPIFPIYNEFYNSSEYQVFKDRPHLLLPKVSKLIKDIRSLGGNIDKKLQLYKQLLPLINSINLQPGFNKQIAELFVTEAQNEDNLKKLLENNRQYSKTIVTYIVHELFILNKLSTLDELINGSLENQELFLTRMFLPILRLLKYADLRESDLRTVATVISAGFPPDGQTFNEGYTFNFIKDIVSNKSITDKRIEDLINLLSANPRVSLSSDEIRKIEDQLNSMGYSSRAKIIKQLKRKSKALLRWLNSDVNDLEREVAYCESIEDMKDAVKAKLYDVLLGKYSQLDDPDVCGKMLNLIKKFNELKTEKSFFISKFVSLALMKSFKQKDTNIVDELWKLNNDHGDGVILAYSLYLLENKDQLKSKEVLSTLKKPPTDFLLLRTIQQSNVSSEALERFIENVGNQFTLNQLTRKRLTTTAKNVEIRNLINEDKLEEAFKVAEKMTSIHGVAFGQNDLLAACVREENLDILRKVFKMVVEKHGKLSGIIDMIVAFLECDKFSKAEELYKGAINTGFSIGSAKLEYITGRELEKKRPDVLHNIFALINDPDHVSTADLTIMLGKIVSMYSLDKNLDGLKKLKSDIERINFKLDRNLSSTLNESIDKLTLEIKQSTNEKVKQT